MTASAYIVTVGAMPSPGADGAAVAAALGAAGVAVVSRVFVEDDESALERALGSDEVLTVVLAGAGGSAGDIVRRVLARVTGARLVLNERLLTTLQERYRRLDRPLPRRAERLALLPQGATVWVTADAEAGWAIENGQRAFAVLTRDAALQTMTEADFRAYAEKYRFFRAQMGAEAILEIIRQIDLDDLSLKLQAEMRSTTGQRRKRAMCHPMKRPFRNSCGGMPASTTRIPEQDTSTR